MNDEQQELVKRLRGTADYLERFRSFNSTIRRGSRQSAIIDLRQAANEIEDLAGLPSTGNYELHIHLAALTREEAMDLAGRAFTAVGKSATHVTVHEEATMPVLKQVGSIGISRG